MAHSLPVLKNNLQSVAVLCDAGCDIFFHHTGCEISLYGKVILRAWRDPKHHLWRVRIVDDGWTTNLRVAEDTPPTKTTSTTAVANLLRL